MPTWFGAVVQHAYVPGLKFSFRDAAGHVADAWSNACDLAVGCWVTAPWGEWTEVKVDVPGGLLVVTAQGTHQLAGPNAVSWTGWGAPSAVYGPEHDGLVAMELFEHQ